MGPADQIAPALLFLAAGAMVLAAILAVRRIHAVGLRWVALLVCLIPTTIGALLAAIGLLRVMLWGILFHSYGQHFMLVALTVADADRKGPGLCHSCTAALKAYGGVKRIAFISPYYPVANEQVRNYFTDSGFERFRGKQHQFCY